MSPLYQPDLTKDTAGFPILPKGDYRLRLGEPKVFSGETKRGPNAGQVNYGIAYTLTVVPGPTDNNGSESPSEHVGKKLYLRLFYHSQESRNYSKGIILAALGYNAREEELFNAKLNELRATNPDDPILDWSFDTDNNIVGTAWRELTGREIVASLSVDKNEDGQEQQKWDQIRPVPVPL